MKKLLFILVFIFFVSCELSYKEIMKLDIPFPCKMTIACWKTFKKTDKSACEKFAEKCKDEYKTYKFKKK